MLPIDVHSQAFSQASGVVSGQAVEADSEMNLRSREGEEVQGKGFATAGPPNSRKGVGFRRSRHVSTSWMLDSGSPDPPVPEPLANFSLSTSCSTWALPLLKGKVAAR